MNKEIETIRDSIILIKQLPESDLKHESLLVLNLLLGEAIIHADWVSRLKYIKEIEEQEFEF